MGSETLYLEYQCPRWNLALWAQDILCVESQAAWNNSYAQKLALHFAIVVYIMKHGFQSVESGTPIMDPEFPLDIGSLRLGVEGLGI